MRLSPPETIAARHRERRAYVSIRQSDPQQVRHNRGSQDNPGTRLRVSLAQRAVGLGWVPEQVQVVDDDQGHSRPGTAGSRRSWGKWPGPSPGASGTTT